MKHTSAACWRKSLPSSPQSVSLAIASATASSSDLTPAAIMALGWGSAASLVITTIDILHFLVLSLLLLDAWGLVETSGEVWAWELPSFATGPPNSDWNDKIIDLKKPSDWVDAALIFDSCEVVLMSNRQRVFLWSLWIFSPPSPMRRPIASSGQYTMAWGGSIAAAIMRFLDCSTLI